MKTRYLLQDEVYGDRSFHDTYEEALKEIQLNEANCDPEDYSNWSVYALVAEVSLEEPTPVEPELNVTVTDDFEEYYE